MNLLHVIFPWAIGNHFAAVYLSFDICDIHHKYTQDSQDSTSLSSSLVAMLFTYM